MLIRRVTKWDYDAPAEHLRNANINQKPCRNTPTARNLATIVDLTKTHCCTLCKITIDNGGKIR